MVFNIIYESEKRRTNEVFFNKLMCKSTTILLLGCFMLLLTFNIWLTIQAQIFKLKDKKPIKSSSWAPKLKLGYLWPPDNYFSSNFDFDFYQSLLMWECILTFSDRSIRIKQLLHRALSIIYKIELNNLYPVSSIFIISFLEPIEKD